MHVPLTPLVVIASEDVGFYTSMVLVLNDVETMHNPRNKTK